MMAIKVVPSNNHFQILIITSLLVVLSSTLLFWSAESTTTTTTIGDLDLSAWLMSSDNSIDASSSSCDGTIGECGLDGDEDKDEVMLDSESNRRILARRGRYISYGALRRNRVPCSRRGASYYNCRPGASANPYRRGCSRITRCRR